MDLRINRKSSVPLYLQISGAIQGMILAGRLPDGFLLPPERRLADSLGVNRTTVVNAYQQLKADGFVAAHVGRGTSVIAPRPEEPGAGPVQPLPWLQLARDGAAREPDPLVRDLLALTERKDVISLAVGLPAPELLPIEALGRIHRRLLAERGAEIFLHSPTEGVTAFREAVCRHMVSRGIQCGAAEVLITSGSQQALDLVARTYLAPGDAVAVEEPSYFGALATFRVAQARLLGVPCDGDGMRTDLLENLLARQRPRLIYTLPTFQNPSGSVLSLERRRRLLELAYRYQVPVLEDDPYSDLRYGGDAVPSLKALDRNGYVIYLSSFSKILFPGLRLGWIAAPRQAVRQLALTKQLVDLHSSTLGQWMVERFIAEGLFSRHLEAVRAEYARRRDAMVQALQSEAPEGLTWSRPEGGFYVWCSFPERVSQSALLQKAAEEHVAFLPGNASFVGEPGRNHLRLNFTYCAPDQIREGVSRLVRAYRAAAAGPRSDERPAGGTPPIV